MHQTPNRSSILLQIPLTWGIFKKVPSKSSKVPLSESSRRSYTRLASKNTPPSTLFGTVSKRKSLHEYTRYDELSEGSGDDYYLSPLLIDGDLNLGDVSGGMVI